MSPQGDDVSVRSRTRASRDGTDSDWSSALHSTSMLSSRGATMPMVDRMTKQDLLDEVVDPSTGSFFGVVVPRLSLKESKAYKDCTQEARERAQEIRANRALSAARARAARVAKTQRSFLLLDEESETEIAPSSQRKKSKAASGRQQPKRQSKGKSSLAWTQQLDSSDSESSFDSEIQSEDGQDDEAEYRERPSKARTISRSHSVVTVSSGGSTSSIEASRPLKKKQRVIHDEEEEEEEEIDELMDSDAEEEEEIMEIEEAGEISLSRHKQTCEKCGDPRARTLLEQLKIRKGRGGRKRTLDEFQEDESERAERLGGWMECAKCCSSFHWGCLPGATRQAFVKQDAQLPIDEQILEGGILPVRRRIRLPNCVYCDPESKTGALTATCFCCNKAKSDAVAQEGGEPSLLFRCTACKRAAHYEHISIPKLADDASSLTRAGWLQRRAWNCPDCHRHSGPIQLVIAWRPSAGADAEPAVYRKQPPPRQADLQREYLVKWKTEGFRHTAWMPHRWLAGRSPTLLSFFLSRGSTLRLQDVTGIDAAADGQGLIESVMDPANDSLESENDPPTADPDALEKIPAEWSRAERLLEVFLLKDAHTQAADGVQPADSALQNIEKWEQANGRLLTKDDAEELAPRVGWAYVKCHDLTYSEATYDTPPPTDSELFPAFVEAMRDYLWQRTNHIPTLTQKEVARRERRDKEMEILDRQPDCISGGKLMDFQLQGLNWLLNKWQHHRSCILADDMGLGKTVQIAAFLTYLGETRKIYPCLIVVPNSTLQNWSRELAKWAPQLRVVPYFGEGTSRDIIRRYDLLHPGMTQKASGLKAHIILTTYEGITNRKDFLFLLNVPRWEMLIVDEAQRLKADTNLLFKSLNELNIAHRVLLTGTPLNNTVREVLNLLNFLDRKEWSNLPELEAYYAEEGEVQQVRFKELREKLALYMLRRRKDEVLQLKQKNEVIVPVTMRPLQKEAYKSILSKDAGLMELIAKATRGESTIPKTGQRVKKLRNMIMQLRKVVQHPFLFTDLDNEDRPLDEQHRSLVDASAKMTWLQMALPVLLRRGHRVLIFSQFAIALNLISDFLDGEGIRHLRLDGNTKQGDRQKAIDRFNKADSDVNVFLLSTRAGGVGINLASADTVIIYDLDWNPQQDAQAIARSHRFGQDKKVLVFRLMMAQSIEERMMQISKKKLVLDHLIVQTAAHTEEEDFATIILDGARALFSDEQQQEIAWDQKGVEELIDEVENRPAPAQQENAGFSFAPVFDSRSKRVTQLDDAPEQAQPADEADFWAGLLKQMQETERQREIEEYGRGARRRNQPAITYAQLDGEGTPKKNEASASDADADFVDLATDQPEDDSASDGVPELPDIEKPTKTDVEKPKKKRPRVQLPVPVPNAGLAVQSAQGSQSAAAVTNGPSGIQLAATTATAPSARAGSLAAGSTARPIASFAPAARPAGVAISPTVPRPVLVQQVAHPLPAPQPVPAALRRRYPRHVAGDRLSPEAYGLSPFQLGQYHLARLAYLAQTAGLDGWMLLSTHLESATLSLEDKYRKYCDLARRTDAALEAFGSQPLFMVPTTLAEMEVFFPAALQHRVAAEDGRRASSQSHRTVAANSNPSNRPTATAAARTIGHGLQNVGTAYPAGKQHAHHRPSQQSQASQAMAQQRSTASVPQPRPAGQPQPTRAAVVGLGSSQHAMAAQPSDGPVNPVINQPANVPVCLICRQRAGHQLLDCDRLRSPESIMDLIRMTAERSEEGDENTGTIIEMYRTLLTERFPDYVRRMAAQAYAAGQAAAGQPGARATTPVMPQSQPERVKRSPRTVISISDEPTRLSGPEPAPRTASQEARRLASTSRDPTPRSSPKPKPTPSSGFANGPSGNQGVSSSLNGSSGSVLSNVAVTSTNNAVAAPFTSTSSGKPVVANTVPQSASAVTQAWQPSAAAEVKPKTDPTTDVTAAQRPRQPSQSARAPVKAESSRIKTYSVRQEGRQRCWMCDAQPKHRVFECPLRFSRQVVQAKLSADPQHPDAELWELWQYQQGWMNS